MVIECIGLSGSGKTELLELIEKELKRREVDYVNVSANLRRGIVWKFLRVIAGPVRTAAVYSFWYRRMIRSHRIFLFDEGMVHMLMMFCADHKISEEAFRKMVMASERGIRSARLVISVEASSAERDDHADEYERLRLAYGRDFRVLEIRGEDENRKKLSRVFGRIRQILTDAGERAAR